MSENEGESPGSAKVNASKSIPSPKMDAFFSSFRAWFFLNTFHPSRCDSGPDLDLTALGRQEPREGRALPSARTLAAPVCGVRFPSARVRSWHLMLSTEAA